MNWDTGILTYQEKYNEVDQECDIFFLKTERGRPGAVNWGVVFHESSYNIYLPLLRILKSFRFLWNLLYDGSVLVAGEVADGRPDHAQLLLMQIKCDKA